MNRNDNIIPPVSYHDLRSFEQLRNLRSQDEGAALKAAAQQFEATFMNMLLKSMREANEVFGDDDVMGGDSVEFYQTMHDEQLAATLSSKGMLGLADLMVKQLSRSAEKPTITISDKTPADFVDRVRPHAKRAAAKLGIDPQVLIAQAALETGWGKTLPHIGNNCFGIKADTRWQGPSLARRTMEVENGVVQNKQLSFRRYDSIAESFDDYVKFVQAGERYQPAVQSGSSQTGSAQHYIQALAKAGYATDPDYAEKITRILNSDALRADRS